MCLVTGKDNPLLAYLHIHWYNVVTVDYTVIRNRHI